MPFEISILCSLHIFEINCCPATYSFFQSNTISWEMASSASTKERLCFFTIAIKFLKLVPTNKLALVFKKICQITIRFTFTAYKACFDLIRVHGPKERVLLTRGELQFYVVGFLQFIRITYICLVVCSACKFRALKWPHPTESNCNETCLEFLMMIKFHPRGFKNPCSSVKLNT